MRAQAPSCQSRHARAGVWGCYHESGTLGSMGLERALDFATAGCVLSQVFGGQDRQRGMVLDWHEVCRPLSWVHRSLLGTPQTLSY